MMTVDEALRHERDRFQFELEWGSIHAMETLAAEVRRLREENERLRNIEHAAQWYVDNPNSQRMAISQIKAAIDAAGCEMTTSVLKMQRELVAVTEDRDRLAAELQKLLEQKPVAYLDYWKSDGTGIVRKQQIKGLKLYAHDPMHRALLQSAPQANAISVRLINALREMKARAYKQLDHGKGRAIFIDSNIAIDIADALLQSADHSEKSLETVTPEFRTSAKDSEV